MNGGVSEKWWCCDGYNIREYSFQFPPGTAYYQTYSVFYTGGLGFTVLRGDATNPPNDVDWHSLKFDHYPDFSSYLCNASSNRTVSCRRGDQTWLGMLLPDIYWHCAAVTPYQQYAGLKGELAIFLALIAFTMSPEQMAQVLPTMLINGEWQTYSMTHGRKSNYTVCDVD